jgi:hypothetical protein
MKNLKDYIARTAAVFILVVIASWAFIIFLAMPSHPTGSSGYDDVKNFASSGHLNTVPYIFKPLSMELELLDFQHYGESLKVYLLIVILLFVIPAPAASISYRIIKNGADTFTGKKNIILGISFAVSVWWLAFFCWMVCFFPSIYVRV